MPSGMQAMRGQPLQAWCVEAVPISKENTELEPLKPMEPMEPMKPMEPMSGGKRWWPEELGQPSTSGSQNGLRYAFFPEKKRLLVEREGTLTTYDSGNHRIGGVAQQASHTQSVAFTSQDGTVDLDELRQVS